MDFSEFRMTYPLRAPDATKIRNQDELKLIPLGHERLVFPADVQAANLTYSDAPRSHIDRGELYLWVVAANDATFALESTPFGHQLETGKVKHTNLTGGADAHCGGELWFISESQVLVGGSSGRYGPKSEKELADVAMAFKSEGFQVASLGYDEETGYPATVLVGEPKWL